MKQYSEGSNLYLEKEDFVNYFKRYNITDDYIENLWVKGDTDKSGYLDEQEFRVMFRVFLHDYLTRYSW